MNIADQLRQLQQLHESGALTDEEFAKAKQAVLGGTPGNAAPEADNAPLRAHFLHKASGPAVPQPVATAPQAGAPASQAAKLAQALPSGPVALHFATLDPGECHRFTFGIQTFTYSKGSLFPPRMPGWWYTFTRFLWHLTDRRILIEPHEITETEGLMTQGVSALMNLNPVGKVTDALSKVDWGGGRKQMERMRGQWFALRYDEIASVEKQRMPPYQFISLAKLVFKDPSLDPVVFRVVANDAGQNAMTSYTGEFIATMAAFLGSENLPGQ